MFMSNHGGRRSAWATTTAACALTASAAMAGNVIYVDDDAPPGGDGSSWKAALNDLQLGLAIVKEGDEIRIAQGVYKPAPPNGPREATFNLVNGTTLRGGYAGIGADDPDANDPKKFESVLSGDLNGDDGPNWSNRSENVYTVIAGYSEITRATRLENLIVQGGNADVYGDWTWPDLAVPLGYGGGLRLDRASPVVSGCIIRGNSSLKGGGAAMSYLSAAIFENCKFLNNTIQAGLAHGGALLISGPAEIIGCEFAQNHAAHDGGAIYGSPAVVRDCHFRFNTAEGGGAIAGSPPVINCTFDNNTASYGGAIVNAGVVVNSRFYNNRGWERGGAIDHLSFAANCTFIGNASRKGCAVFARSDATLINCTIVGNICYYPHNSAAVAASAFVAPSRTLAISNCVIWGNACNGGSQSGQLITYDNFNASVENTVIQGWDGSLGGTNNHGNDPRFIDADGPDNIYGTEDDNPRLLANSPLIDHGDNAALPPDTYDLDEDGDTTEPISVDLDWLPRIVGKSVDVGAFEFQGLPCLADITGDSNVNVNDLLAVINTWGQCASAQPCNTDLNLDGEVHAEDLMTVITNWGACP